MRSHRESPSEIDIGECWGFRYGNLEIDICEPPQP